jgi:SNF2 family DNA or RNA helicase
MELHLYQKEAVEFCRKKKRVYLALDVGLGKSVIALKTIEDSKAKTIIIAPLRVIYVTWPEEIEKWTNLSYTILHGRDKNRNLRLKRDLYLINYEGLKWLISELTKGKVPYMNLILDEASWVQSWTTTRYAILLTLLPMFKYYRLALSATPAPNGLQGLWTQYYMLDEGRSLGKKVTHYTRKYFSYSQDKHRYFISKGSREKIYKKIRPITYRLEAKDYIHMPPIIYNRVSLIMPPEIRHKYNQLERDFEESSEEDAVTAFNAARLTSQLRQFVQGGLYTERPEYKLIHTLKVKALRELMESANGQPILCAIQFRFEYELLKAEFGNRVPIIYGKTTKSNSLRYLRKWNRGELPLLLAHPQSLSHGLNLQAGGRIVVWLALPWSLDHFHQFNGRLHRQGQKHGVVVNAVMFDDSIDEVIWGVIKRKDASMQHLLAALKERSRR